MIDYRTMKAGAELKAGQLVMEVDGVAIPATTKFYRRHKASERPRADDLIQKLTYKEVRTLLYATHKNPVRAIARLLKGEKVATNFGTYWATTV